MFFFLGFAQLGKMEIWTRKINIYYLKITENKKKKYFSCLVKLKNQRNEKYFLNASSNTSAL